MNTIQKLNILGSGANYDVCGSARNVKKKRDTLAMNSLGVYDCTAKEENCRVMKVLFSNSCLHDCKYCYNSAEGKQKTIFEPEELAKTATKFYKDGLVHGLFLSSAVTKDTDLITEKMIETAKIMRERLNFTGYLHLKLLPGVSKDHVKELARYADRLSVNIESPEKSSFSEMSSTKDYNIDILRRMRWAKEMKEKGLVKSGHTTQMIVGGAGENDSSYIKSMNKLYNEMKLNRVYFSAFHPVRGTELEKQKEVPAVREHRLYQTDWLMREYGYSPNEMISVLNDEGNLNLHTDPKILFASEEKLLLDPKNSSYGELLRIPGIGPKTAENIVKGQKNGEIASFNDLKKKGVILKRALPYLKLKGSRQFPLSEFA